MLKDFITNAAFYDRDYYEGEEEEVLTEAEYREIGKASIAEVMNREEFKGMTIAEVSKIFYDRQGREDVESTTAKYNENGTIKKTYKPVKHYAKDLVRFENARIKGFIPMKAGPILCYVAREGYTEKPTVQSEFMKQRNRFSYHHLGKNGLRNWWNIEELKSHIEKGCSIQNGEFREPMASLNENPNTFCGAQLERANMIIIDIDKGNASIEDILEWCKPYRPSMIYHTLSSIQSARRYRVMFLLDQWVAPVEYQMLTQYFINRTPGADQSCKDPARMYLGGKSVPFMEGNFLEVVELLALPEVEMLRARLEIGKTTRLKKQKVGKEIAEPITVKETELVERLKALSEKMNIHRVEEMKSFDFINTLPITELIGVEVGDKFRCILPDHHDNNASANILETEDNRQLYKCFGCTGKAINTLGLVERMTGKALKEARDFILGAMDIKFDTAYRCESLVTIQFNRMMISRDRESEIYKKLRYTNLLGTYIAFTNYMENYLPENPIKENEISMFASIERLSLIFKDWDISGSSTSSISRKMNALVSYGLLRKIDHKDLPENLRIKSLEVQAQNNTRYQVTYWVLPELSSEMLDRALAKMKAEKGVGYTKEHLNRVQMLKMHGEEETHKVYNQDELHYSEHVYSEINYLATELIERHGYFTKQLILDHSEYSRKKVMQYLPGVAREMGLVYASVNRELTEWFGLDLPRNSKIFIKKPREV